MKIKRFGKNEFDFWILHIKIRLYKNFHENLRKIFLTNFLSHFLLMEAKMKMKIKKFGKVSSIFKSSISKIGYMANFMKIGIKTFDQLFMTYLTNRGNNKYEDEKTWENAFYFWIFNIKIRTCDHFHDNLRTKFFINFLRHFLLMKAKMKIKIKKLEKWVRFFNFPC